MSGSEALPPPIFDVDTSKDVKAYYHNVAYKANRMAINVEKMKVREACALPWVTCCTPGAHNPCCCCCRSSRSAWEIVCAVRASTMWKSVNR